MQTKIIELMQAAQLGGPAARHPAPALVRACTVPPSQPAAEPWREALALIALHVPLARRPIAAGMPIQHAGDPFARLHLVNRGVCKSVGFGGDGRQQIVALHFRGDWVGFDGIAHERCATDACAMNDSEIWSMNYAALLKVAAGIPALARLIAAAMSAELARTRAWRNALCTLAALQRVADFLCGWHRSQHERAPPGEAIVLCMTRAEIGNYLGLTTETVSRAMSQLEQRGLIGITAHERRHIGVPDVAALCRFAAATAERGGQRAIRAMRPPLSAPRGLPH